MAGASAVLCLMLCQFRQQGRACAVAMGVIAASVVAVGVIAAGAVAGVVLDAAGLFCFSGDGGGLIQQQGLAGAVALGVIAAGAVAGVELDDAGSSASKVGMVPSPWSRLRPASLLWA